MEMTSLMVNMDWFVHTLIIYLKHGTEFMMFTYEINNESAIRVAVVSWLISESIGFTIWIVESGSSKPRN
jgi:uncharacterized membrane protein (GlpM family)